MTAKTQSGGESFVKLPRDMLASIPWRSLNGSSFRLLTFLMIEQARHNGKHNGRLLAPRRQLEAFGIGEHLVSQAIDEAERVGLIGVKRGVGRAPSLYALTWLPTGEKQEHRPTNRWRESCCTTAAVEVIVSRKGAKTRAVATVKRQSLRVLSNDSHRVLSNDSHKPRSDCQMTAIKP